MAEESKFKWTIEEISSLKPADIDETTVELFDPVEPDPQHELMAQASIERFFNEKHIVPSPFNNAVKSVELLKAPPAPPAAVQTAEGDTLTLAPGAKSITRNGCFRNDTNSFVASARPAEAHRGRPTAVFHLHPRSTAGRDEPELVVLPASV